MPAIHHRRTPDDDDRPSLLPAAGSELEPKPGRRMLDGLGGSAVARRGARRWRWGAAAGLVGVAFLGGQAVFGGGFPAFEVLAGKIHVITNSWPSPTPVAGAAATATATAPTVAPAVVPMVAPMVAPATVAVVAADPPDAAPAAEATAPAVRTPAAPPRPAVHGEARATARGATVHTPRAAPSTDRDADLVAALINHARAAPRPAQAPRTAAPQPQAPEARLDAGTPLAPAERARIDQRVQRCKRLPEREQVLACRRRACEDRWGRVLACPMKLMPGRG